MRKWGAGSDRGSERVTTAVSVCMRSHSAGCGAVRVAPGCVFGFAVTLQGLLHTAAAAASHAQQSHKISLTTGQLELLAKLLKWPVAQVRQQ